MIATVHYFTPQGWAYSTDVKIPLTRPILRFRLNRGPVEVTAYESDGVEFWKYELHPLDKRRLAL